MFLYLHKENLLQFTTFITNNPKIQARTLCFEAGVVE